jgi:hypothetical protein
MSPSPKLSTRLGRYSFSVWFFSFLCCHLLSLCSGHHAYLVEDISEETPRERLIDGGRHCVFIEMGVIDYRNREEKHHHMLTNRKPTYLPSRSLSSQLKQSHRRVPSCNIANKNQKPKTKTRTQIAYHRLKKQNKKRNKRRKRKRKNHHLTYLTLLNKSHPLQPKQTLAAYNTSKQKQHSPPTRRGPRHPTR